MHIFNSMHTITCKYTDRYRLTHTHIHTYVYILSQEIYLSVFTNFLKDILLSLLLPFLYFEFYVVNYHVVFILKSTLLKCMYV